MAIKKYNIKVNGKSYEVEVEEIDVSSLVVRGNTEVQASISATSGGRKDISAAPMPTTTKPVAPRGDEKEIITAPLPGKIMSLKVEVGQAVQAGDLICILEAMKMENELYASVNGTVKEILVADGATVAAGESLVIIN
ncbi:MAG: biotin/lipoyl-containing protein [Peptococcia bacterium]